jgi:hypothetical protein
MTGLRAAGRSDLGDGGQLRVTVAQAIGRAHLRDLGELHRIPADIAVGPAPAGQLVGPPVGADAHQHEVPRHVPGPGRLRRISGRTMDDLGEGRGRHALDVPAIGLGLVATSEGPAHRLGRPHAELGRRCGRGLVDPGVGVRRRHDERRGAGRRRRDDRRHAHRRGALRHEGRRRLRRGVARTDARAQQQDVEMARAHALGTISDPSPVERHSASCPSGQEDPRGSLMVRF